MLVAGLPRARNVDVGSYKELSRQVNLSILANHSPLQGWLCVDICCENFVIIAMVKDVQEKVRSLRRLARRLTSVILNFISFSESSLF